MAKIKLTGGTMISVPVEKAEKIRLFKWGDKEKGIPAHSPDKMIEINGNFMELKDVRGIINEEYDAQSEVNDERGKKRAEDMAEHERLIAIYRKQDPLEKAARMMRSGVILAYAARGYKKALDTESELFAKILYELVAWFDLPEQKNAYWAPVGVYKHLIPHHKSENQVVRPVTGFKTFGEAMQEVF